MKMMNIKRNQDGAALVIGLLLLVVITVLAVSGMNTATTELAMESLPAVGTRQPMVMQRHHRRNATPVRLGAPPLFQGGEIRFFYTLPSIPTIGGSVTASSSFESS